MAERDITSRPVASAIIIQVVVYSADDHGGTRLQAGRIRTGTGACRVIDAATIGEAVYVLHRFEKRSQRTAKIDIDLAKKRYRQAADLARAEEQP